MTATTSPAPAGRRRRPVLSAGTWCAPITGFRAIAAMLVVIGHSFMAATIFPFAGVIHVIGFIVPTFFVISAYALYRPFMVHQLKGEAPPAAAGFWWRRFLRVYPLYFVALSAYLLLLPGVRPASGSILDYLKLYSFLQVYDADLSRFSGIPAAWFLCDEVAFYALVPGIALVARNLTARLVGARGPARPATVLAAHTWVAVAMIVIGQVSRTWLILRHYPSATSIPIANLDYYGFGILLAVGSLRERAGLGLPRWVDQLRRLPSLGLGVLVFGSVVMGVLARHPGTNFSPTEDVQRYALYSMMVVPFMVVLVLGRQDGGYNRRLASARWAWLGALSLHVYLWHQGILGVFDRYVTELAKLEIGTRWLTAIIVAGGALVLTIAWSALTRPALDRPYARWSKALPRPADAAPLPAWTRPAAIGVAVALLASGVVLALAYGGSPAEARGGVELITVTGVHPGDTVTASRRGEASYGDADERGTKVLRGLRPGRYAVEVRRGDRLVVRTHATVMDPDDHPVASWYDGRSLHEGMNEITTRDGTRLAAYVRLPGPADKGPYPTVVEYSGYQIADPDVTQPASAVARALGYATVGVQVRGSGCSAGAFEMLGAATAADGYDAVETVARQPWVRGHEVGLVGFSYGGLGALEVAATRPPSLSGVAALSVYGEAWEAFHPGGLDNSGFPVGWMQDFQRDVAPAGADWVRARIADGDTACRRNQQLHGQAVDLKGTYLGDVPNDGRFDPISVATWAPSITAPTFLAGQFQDATIGSDLADAFGRFRSKRLTMVLSNGTHGDGVAPQVLRRMDQFLSLYVAGRTPGRFDTEEILRTTRPDAKADAAKVPVGPAPPVSFPKGTSLADARRAYEASPPVEVLYESGNTRPAGAATAASSATFASWPPPDAAATAFALRADGTLADGPTDEATDPATFRTDPDVSGDAYNIEGSDLATNTMSEWVQPDPDTARSWVSAPFDQSVSLTGTASVDLWIRSDVRDPQLQVGLSAVDPEGEETMLQVGWLDTRYRSLDPSSTPLRPVHRWDRRRHLPTDTWVQVRVRVGPMGQIVRAGSRLRLVVGTPGAGQVQWSFFPPASGAATVDVGQGGAHASVLQIPVVADPAVPDRTPGCGDLRGQPCRTYEPLGAGSGDGR